MLLSALLIRIYLLKPLDVKKLSYENGLIKIRQAMFNHTNAVIHPIVFAE